MISEIKNTELERDDMISKMNRLGAAREAFLFVIDYRAKNGFVFCNDELNTDFVRFSLHAERPHSNAEKPLWNTFPVSMAQYRKAFEYVQNQICKGNSFLVNLTKPTRLETDLTLESIFEKSYAAYKLWLKDRFTVLSPECFVRIENGRISSFPMKGTIDAAIPDAENIILNDYKEKAEHATIVDLIRNDLSMVADRVEVKRYRYIDRLKTNKGDLLQVSSEISGMLPQNFHENLGDIIFRLLPAGSISGAPKPKTMEIIETAEAYERGYYTGVFGFFDGENLDSAVMIRFVEQQNDGLIFKSGGGITSLSDCEKEYDELLRKVYVPLY